MSELSGDKRTTALKGDNRGEVMFVPIRKKVDILRHEAGHLVIAKLLGFETGCVQLTAKDAGAEITLTPLLTDIASAQDYMRRRITVLYAGVMTEFLRAGKVDLQLAEDALDETAVNDHAKIRELLRLWVGFVIREEDFHELMQVFADQCRDRAQILVEKHALLIIEVSKDLSKNLDSPGGVLSEERVNDLPSVQMVKVGSEV